MKLYRLEPLWASIYMSDILTDAGVEGRSREIILDRLESRKFYVNICDHQPNKIGLLWRLLLIPFIIFTVIMRLTYMPIKWMVTGEYWMEFKENNWLAKWAIKSGF